METDSWWEVWAWANVWTRLMGAVLVVIYLLSAEQPSLSGFITYVMTIGALFADVLPFVLAIGVLTRISLSRS